MDGHYQSNDVKTVKGWIESILPFLKKQAFYDTHIDIFFDKREFSLLHGIALIDQSMRIFKSAILLSKEYDIDYNPSLVFPLKCSKKLKKFNYSENYLKQ